ncbi:Iron-sulfur cluster assembly ATPase protein SufC [hydrothermal vent metagenome]|jgi:Fe-S cluster assembly ATP-binding protein|uniref:Iron-sulfur cluster assembly ATPase protein SufC n=2 Tax=ecological metagenomes TaxID=410657 RepID=A0A160VFR8_9ZZZZ|nr:Fe-S cluster assembly ATPase SufC [Candidatus Neomarinimicrobiota bacterium]MEC7760138.1 Fe-S cluster assembly ATPase SufC [Candidatus Neomarinimicrobiota bacterium]MEE3135299.1 Fe-S cluster assembly ATPase SufC [Candidatus Neomarinimicrobiota bacterium]|tara:strand:- start:761 stop:1501 length:741 start_codon:yes stop_codon:yes gene_type:complete
MLKIKNLHAGIDGKAILKGINLTIQPGELHAIMGRNGSGKSTLANVITGRDNYEVIKGSILFNNIDLLGMSPEDRALSGIFMSFQYPVVIPGVNNTYFLRAALNAKLKHQGLKEINAADFLRLIREKLNLIQMDEKYLNRGVNDGFSGGEKKHNEILQMLTLEPALSILDETDSGLDIDALKIIANGVNNFRNNDRSFLAITHYPRLLEYMKPDFIHVLIDGEFVKSGDASLAFELEEKGYSWLEA